MPFYPELTLPDSSAGFKLEANIKAVTAINEISIYTDAGAFGADPVKCTADATSKLITCKNIGKLASNQTKYLKFAFTIEKGNYDEDDINELGTMIIKTNDGTNTITTSVKPSDITPKKAYDASYDKNTDGNRVSNINDPASTFMTAAEFVAAYTNSDGISSIKYSNAEMNLFFPIDTSADYKKTCCGSIAGTDFLDCPAANAGSTCASVSGGGWGDSLILKIIANSNALSLSNDDNDTTASGNIYKGVELYPPADTSTAGMFGMVKFPTTTPATTPTKDHLCLSKDGGKRMCSTYSRYVTYKEA